jgi:SAM-dependent methyltransferase
VKAAVQWREEPDIAAVLRDVVLPLYGDPGDPLTWRVTGSVERLQLYCELLDAGGVTARRGRVADLGAGLTGLAPLLQALGARVTIVDDFGGGGSVDRQNPDAAHAILSRLRGRLGVEIVEQDLLTTPLPFADDSVDVVTSFHCLEHLHHSPRGLMEEIRRVLRPGGRFVIGTPNAVNLRKRLSVFLGRTNLGELEEWYFDGSPYRGHVREPVVADLVRLCEWNGLGVERVVGANFLGTTSKSFATLPRFLQPFVRGFAVGVLPRWPGLCSDIHVVAAKQAPNGTRH